MANSTNEKADLRRKGKKIHISFEVSESTADWMVEDGKRLKFEAGKHKVTVSE